MGENLVMKGDEGRALDEDEILSSFPSDRGGSNALSSCDYYVRGA